MPENQFLCNEPPSWLDDDEVIDLPNVTIDKRELWEIVATCTPMACISAHYSSLTLRVVADWLDLIVMQADANGWDIEPWQLVQSLRNAAIAADVAIDSDECLPRGPHERGAR